jgi:phosphoribosylamine---glycine ligase
MMLTNEGVKTIEFNVRFGDPETEVLCSRLITPIDQVIEKVLNKEHCELEFDPSFALGVVLASKGYPEKYTTHHPILGLELLNVKCVIWGRGMIKDLSHKVEECYL